MQTKIDPKRRPSKEENLKCLHCGHEALWKKDEDYDTQSDCIRCGDQMMSRWWGGWGRTIREKREYNKHWRDLEAERERRAAEPVSQETEPIKNFSDKERRIHHVMTFTSIGQEAPWMGPFGASLVKIYGIRRAEDGSVEFGIGNEEPPILGWVHATDFYNEWPA